MFTAIFTVSRWGRKTLWLLGVSAMAVLMLLMALGSHYEIPGLLIPAMILFFIFYNSSGGALPPIYTTEICYDGGVVLSN